MLFILTLESQTFCFNSRKLFSFLFGLQKKHPAVAEMLISGVCQEFFLFLSATIAVVFLSSPRVTECDLFMVEVILKCAVQMYRCHLPFLFFCHASLSL